MEDLHELLGRFERAGRLLRVTAPVDPRFELPGSCTRLHRDSALRQHVALFENVQGHSMPVVGNLCDTREKVAFALGCEPHELLARGVRAVEQPIPRNPSTGVRNMGVQRNMYHEPALLGIYMAPTHMFQHYLQMEAQDKPLPVAIAVGTHPALMVASQMRIAYDEDEMAAGGGLIGEPAELVRCRTV